MKKQRSSIDGFIPRRSNNSLGDIHSDNNQSSILLAPETRAQRIGGNNMVSRFGKQKTNMSVGRSDIDESLRDIDDSTEPIKKLSRRQRRRIAKMARRPKNRKSRVIKRILITLLVVILVFGGYATYRFIVAGNNIFQGNFFDIFQSQALKQDSNGRSNFLILGTSEDDPGHPGSTLTDSMLVLSIDQKNKNAFMFSVPRDLLVEYGEACIPGYSGLINAYFTCADSGTSNSSEQNRLTKTQELVGDIFGIDIQYGIHVNYTVMRDVVNAIGGNISVKIESRDPRGQMDSNFDWKCGANYYKRIRTCPPNGHFIDYPNGQVTLDAEHALYLAQARGDMPPTYGFEKSNFDRERNQQKILVAIRDKAMSTGTLTNLGAVTNLVDALGNNLRTNIQTKEIRTLMQVASEIKSEDIHTISLIDGDYPVMNGSGNPSAGNFDYTDIQVFIKKSLSNDPMVREAAPIVVLNGTGQSGFGQTKADTLIKLGFNVTLTDNAPDGTYDNVEIYQIGKGNSATASKLTKMYKVTIKKSAPPVVVNGNVRFVIIFGATTE